MVSKLAKSRDRFKLIVAVYLVLRQNNQVLLLQRANTGYQDGSYSFIAGHLNGDELATDAMAREAKEEAGIIIDPKDLQLVHTIHRLSRGELGQERIDLFFETNKWQGKIVNAEPKKCTDLSWYDLSTLPKNTMPLAQLTLDHIARGDIYSEFVDKI